MSVVAQMTKQERLGWLGVTMLSPVVLYLAWSLFVDPMGRGGDVAAIPRRVANGASLLFLGAYYLWIHRRSAGLQVDERDRWITARAVRAGLLALVGTIALVVGTVALEWEHAQAFVHSRSPAWISTYLMLGVYLSMAVMSAVRIGHYWRDRL